MVVGLGYADVGKKVVGVMVKVLVYLLKHVLFPFKSLVNSFFMIRISVIIQVIILKHRLIREPDQNLKKVFFYLNGPQAPVPDW